MEFIKEFFILSTISFGFVIVVVTGFIIIFSIVEKEDNKKRDIARQKAHEAEVKKIQDFKSLRESQIKKLDELRQIELDKQLEVLRNQPKYRVCFTLKNYEEDDSFKYNATKYFEIKVEDSTYFSKVISSEDQAKAYLELSFNKKFFTNSYGVSYHIGNIGSAWIEKEK